MIKANKLLEFRCNVDDMTGEAVSFAMERLFEAGALDVYTMPVGMKKSRPGLLIHVTCREADREAILETIFKHTTTIGIREQISNRYTLKRSIETVETSYGPVRKKISSGYGVQREKYEYEDLADIARKKNLSITDVLSDIGGN